MSAPSQSSRPRASGRDPTRWPAVRRVLLIVLALNGLVALVKIYVGVRTGALTVLGAALESTLDMLNNVLGMALVGVASRAPDAEHPYGHAKFETIGALGIVGFLSISCFELLRRGVTLLTGAGSAPMADATQVGLLAATIGVNVGVVFYERRRGRELASSFLVADAAHTRSDVLVTLLALTSLASARLGAGWVDGALAIAVAVVIARSGYHILRESIPVLVDERAIDAVEIARVVRSVDEVVDVRAIRSRYTPSGELFAEVTIVVRDDTTVARAHELSDAVEAAIEREFGDGVVTVHVEPT